MVGWGDIDEEAGTAFTESADDLETSLRQDLARRLRTFKTGLKKRQEEQKKEAVTELHLYRRVPRSGKQGDNPLLWWKKNKNTFPYLAPLARRDLAVFGRQAAVERIFSKAGMLVSKLRSKMLPATAARMLFCMVNSDLIEIV